MFQLSAEQARVVGALIEKQLTTPQQYPLSLNALVAACNQTSNRDPVVAYDERTVDAELSQLKAGGLVRFVHPTHGRGVTKFRQVLEEVLDLDERSLAVLGMLVLRGPQTVGELRGRAERMADVPDLAAVEATLDALAGREEPLVLRLDRQPGQKEARYVHLLCGRDAALEAAAAVPAATGAPAARNGSRLETLEDDVRALREEVRALRAELDALRAELG